MYACELAYMNAQVHICVCKKEAQWIMRLCKSWEEEAGGDGGGREKKCLDQSGNRQ